MLKRPLSLTNTIKLIKEDPDWRDKIDPEILLCYLERLENNMDRECDWACKTIKLIAEKRKAYLEQQKELLKDKQCQPEKA